jgi:hypothetical protein
MISKLSPESSDADHTSAWIKACHSAQIQLPVNFDRADFDFRHHTGALGLRATRPTRTPASAPCRVWVLIDPFAERSGNGRYVRIPALPGTQRERLLRVDLTHSAHPRAMTGVCAQRATGIEGLCSLTRPPNLGSDSPRSLAGPSVFLPAMISERRACADSALIGTGLKKPARARYASPSASLRSVLWVSVRACS